TAPNASFIRNAGCIRVEHEIEQPDAFLLAIHHQAVCHEHPRVYHAPNYGAHDHITDDHEAQHAISFGHFKAHYQEGRVNVMRYRPPRSGFTLLEVMLAAAIGVLLMAGLYTALNLTLSHAQAGRDKVEQSTVARSLFRRISSDVRTHLAPYRPSQASGGGGGGAAGGAGGGGGAVGSGGQGTGSTGQSSTTGGSSASSSNVTG